MSVKKSGSAGSFLTLFLFSVFIIFSGCSGSGSSDDGSVFLQSASVEIASDYAAPVPALDYRKRAAITQGQGEYAGVDNWAAHDPVPAGTRLVNGGTSNLFSEDFSNRSIVAYSNYFATPQALDDAMSGGLLDSAFFNGLVQVGPWRPDGTTGDFTYRRFGITYEVVRPMPVAHSICLNNPQMDTAFAPGGASQFFAPFIRQDLIRLGYVRMVDAVDSGAPSRVSAIPRYVALYGHTAAADELNQMALADYTTLIEQRPPEEQQQAAALRAEAIALRADKRRSAQSFAAVATGGDVQLAAGRRIDGYAQVQLAASRHISVGGTIWGMDRILASAGMDCLVAEGGLIEAWTDRIPPGDQAVTLSCGAIYVDGRIQSQAAPWTSWSGGVPGKITLTTSNADTSATGISISGPGQVLALLQTNQADYALNAVRMISPGSGIDVNGSGYGFNVVADKGTIHIENTGADGAVNILGQAAMSAAIVKAGAVGPYGTLVIHAGSHLDANTLIKLFGGIETGGTILFQGAGDVILTSGDGADPILMSADTVKIETGTRLVTRSWVQTGGVWNRVETTADVYCNSCNWSAASGGDPTAGHNGTWSASPNRAGPPPANRSF
jgi:hypothetical protein